MALLVRLGAVGAVLGTLTLIALQFPPFPQEFGDAIYAVLVRVFALDVFLPTKLAVNLVLASWLIDILVFGMKGAVWLYKLIFGHTD